MKHKQSGFGVPFRDIDVFATYLDGQLPNVRELFQYALAVLMVAGGKATIVQTHMTDDGRQQLLIQTEVVIRLVS